MYIHLLCLSGDSYQESKPGNEKRKSEVSSSHVISRKTNLKIENSPNFTLESGLLANILFKAANVSTYYQKNVRRDHSNAQKTLFNWKSVHEPLDLPLQDSLLGLSFAFGDRRSFLPVQPQD